MANQTPDAGYESEWLTRKRRIDPLLDAADWPRRKGKGNAAFRTEGEETAHGPADYALWLDDRVVGIVEAKKLTIGPQNVLTQAERYARGLKTNAFDFDGVRCPFLYATNGEVIWFHDAPHELNRSRQVKADLWALALTIFEAGAGHPFRQGLERAATQDDALRAFTAVSLPGATPPGGVALFEAALAVDRARRPRSAAELRSLLEGA